MADKEIRIDLGDGHALIAEAGCDSDHYEIYISVDGQEGLQDIAMVGIDRRNTGSARILRWLDPNIDAYTDESSVRIVV